MFLRKIIFFIFIFSALFYELFAARGVLFPPKLKIISPKDGEKITGTRVYFSGNTIPNASLWVDGARIESEKSGFFEGFLTFHPGYNELGISVKNKFDRETRKVIRFVND